MGFRKSSLIEYKSSSLFYPQKFADYSHYNQRLNDASYQVIKSNVDFGLNEGNELKVQKKQRPRLRL